MPGCFLGFCILVQLYHTERQIVGTVAFITLGKSHRQLAVSLLMDMEAAVSLFAFVFAIHPPLLLSVFLLNFPFLWVGPALQNLSPLSLSSQRAVKVHVCDRRVIRVFLGSKSMRHRESQQLKETYLAALTWNRSISSANSTSVEKGGGSPLKQHTHSLILTYCRRKYMQGTTHTPAHWQKYTNLGPGSILCPSAHSYLTSLRCS